MFKVVKIMQIKNIFKKFIALLLSTTFLAVCLSQSYVFAEEQENYSNVIGKWKVQTAWSNISDHYSWYATNDTENQPKQIVAYRIDVAEHDYNPGDITFIVPGIGESNRIGTKKATDIAGNSDDSEWDYSYNKESDTYTFTNKFSIAEGESVNGGFEIMWTVKARDTIDHYHQEKSTVFSVDGETISLPPLDFDFQSKRDMYKIYINKDGMTKKHWDSLTNDGQDTSYTWETIAVSFERELWARALYKARCFITFDLPEGTTLDDIKVNYPIVTNEKGEKGFYLFDTLYENDLKSPKTFDVGLDKDLFEGKEIKIHAHLDCLFNDESEWTTTPLDYEIYDADLSYISESYGFPWLGTAFEVFKSTYDYGDREPYKSRLDVSQLFAGADVEFSIGSWIQKHYDERTPLRGRSAANNTKSSDQDYVEIYRGDIMLGDDKLAVYLNDGSVRNLSDDEYDFTHIVLNGIKETNTYKVYAATTQDAPLSQYNLVAQGVLNENKTISFQPGIKAFYIYVDDAEADFSFNVNVGVNFHFDNDAEMEKPKAKRIDPEKYITNFDYMRFFDENGRDTIVTPSYIGAYGNTLSQRDNGIFGSNVFRRWSEVWLKVNSTYIESETAFGPFSGSSKKGFSSTVTSSGQIQSDYESEISKFSLVTMLPDVLSANLRDDMFNISGNAYFSTGLPADISKYVAFRNVVRDGTRYLIADFDFSESPLSAKDAINVNVRYPISISAKDYVDYGQSYSASTFLVIQDVGTDYMRLHSSNLVTDTYDYDLDNNRNEQGALSHAHTKVNDNASEWREYETKTVKSAFDSNFIENTVVQVFDANNDPNLSKYTYKLEFGVGSDYAKNVTFFDSLESGASIPLPGGQYNTFSSDWQGTFDSIDTSFAESLGLITTVYYSTVQTNSRNINDSEWTTTCPSDKSTIKSIAVHFDTSNLVDGWMARGEYVYVLMSFTAPSDVNLIGTKAVNQFNTTYDAYALNGNYEQLYDMPSSKTEVELLGNVGNAKIQKVDAESDKPLSGAVFELYRLEQGQYVSIGQRTTDKYGEISLDKVECGQYKYVEVTPPQGYTGNRVGVFSVNGLNDAPIVVENAREKGSVTINKTDFDTGSIIRSDAAHFNLYKKDGTLLILNEFADEYYADDEYGMTDATDVISTYSEGRASIVNLDWGDYYLVEIDSPEGYEVGNTKIPFTIGPGNLNISLDVENKQIRSSMILEKTDSLTGAPLQNAYFKLEKYNSSTNEWINAFEQDDLFRTNAAGELMVDNLLFGTYRWVEVKPPAGYELSNPKVVTISPSDAGKTIRTSISDVRKTGSVKLRKTNENGNPLKNCVFSLYDSNDVLIMDGLFTDLFGETQVITGLEWGQYYFKESKAASGYKVNTNKIEFEISASNADFTQVVLASNEKKLGSVCLIKTNDVPNSGVLLSGAKFNLYTDDGALVASNLITNSNGEIFVEDLDWGSYYFEEIEAPSGYSVSSKKVRFTINASNADTSQTVVCENSQGLCSLKVDKEINESYDEFGQATFIFIATGIDTNGDVHKYTKSLTLNNSNKNGSVVFSDIPSGTYTVEEKEVARYTQESVVGITSNVVVSSGKATVDLLGCDFGEVKFVNNMRQYEKLSHSVVAINSITKSRKLVGISVDYNGPNPIQSEEDTSYTFSNSDVSVVAFYDNGTQKNVNFSDLVVTPNMVTSENNAGNTGETITVSYTEDGITVSDSFSVKINLPRGNVRRIFTFDANGGFFDGGALYNQIEYEYSPAGTFSKISGNYLEPSNGVNIFAGWYTTQTCDEGTMVDVSFFVQVEPESDVTLYAKWDANTVIETGQIGTNVYYDLYRNGVMVIRGSGQTSAYNSSTAPFSGRTDINSVIVENGVTGLGNYLFANCSSIESVSLPASITRIGNFAFFENSSLRTINFPNGLTTIGSSAFASCTSLREAIMPNTVTTLGATAFQACESLRNVVISNRITAIGANTFQSCDSVVSLTIPDSVTSIAANAITNCANLKNITLSNNLTTLGNNALSRCPKLEYVKIPASVTNLTFSTSFNPFVGDKKASIDCTDNPNAEAFCVAKGFTRHDPPDIHVFTPVV